MVLLSIELVKHQVPDLPIYLYMNEDPPNKEKYSSEGQPETLSNTIY